MRCVSRSVWQHRLDVSSGQVLSLLEATRPQSTVRCQSLFVSVHILLIQSCRRRKFGPLLIDDPSLFSDFRHGRPHSGVVDLVRLRRNPHNSPNVCSSRGRGNPKFVCRRLSHLARHCSYPIPAPLSAVQYRMLTSITAPLHSANYPRL
jgi:hypothetical protein